MGIHHDCASFLANTNPFPVWPMTSTGTSIITLELRRPIVEWATPLCKGALPEFSEEFDVGSSRFSIPPPNQPLRTISDLGQSTR